MISVDRFHWIFNAGQLIFYFGKFGHMSIRGFYRNSEFWLYTWRARDRDKKIKSFNDKPIVRRVR